MDMNNNVKFMLPDLNEESNPEKKLEPFTDLSFIKPETIEPVPDKKIIKKAQELLRLQQICKELPDHCAQLLFLS